MEAQHLCQVTLPRVRTCSGFEGPKRVSGVDQGTARLTAGALPECSDRPAELMIRIQAPGS